MLLAAASLGSTKLHNLRRSSLRDGGKKLRTVSWIATSVSALLLQTISSISHYVTLKPQRLFPTGHVRQVGTITFSEEVSGLWPEH